MYLWMDKTSKEDEEMHENYKIERDKGVSFKHPFGHLNTPIKHSNIQKFFCFPTSVFTIF